LLRLANGVLRQRVKQLEQPLPDALDYVDHWLEQRGVTAFDLAKAEARDQAVSKTLQISLEQLEQNQRARFVELAIFPQDVDIPLVTVQKLWGATARLDDLDTEDLCTRFFEFSLLLKLDLIKRCIRLHDVIRAYLLTEHAPHIPGGHDHLCSRGGDEQYLRQKIAQLQQDWKLLSDQLEKLSTANILETRPEEKFRLEHLITEKKNKRNQVEQELQDLEKQLSEGHTKDKVSQKNDHGLPGLHNHFLNAYALKNWAELPAEEQYLWDHLAYHLKEAGHQSELCTLIQDFDWLQAKLNATNINALIADYRGLPKEEALDMIQRALRKSAHVLAQDKTQLVSQLVGRLTNIKMSEVQTLLNRAQRYKAKPWLCPLIASLKSPDDPLLQTLIGHEGGVRAVAVIPNSGRILSGGRDHTLKIWDLDSGINLETLKGHEAWVMAVAVTPDGQRAVSASDDQTLKVWDLQEYKELHTLKGHDYPTAVVVTPNGQRIVSISRDHQTLKIWNLNDGTEQQTLTGYNRGINLVAVTSAIPALLKF
jgi:hypothetical protein